MPTEVIAFAMALTMIGHDVENVSDLVRQLYRIGLSRVVLLELVEVWNSRNSRKWIMNDVADEYESNEEDDAVLELEGL